MEKVDAEVHLATGLRAVPPAGERPLGCGQERLDFALLVALALVLLAPGLEFALAVQFGELHPPAAVLEQPAAGIETLVERRPRPPFARAKFPERPAERVGRATE